MTTDSSLKIDVSVVHYSELTRLEFSTDAAYLLSIYHKKDLKLLVSLLSKSVTS
jgi:hypothetical protein